MRVFDAMVRIICENVSKVTTECAECGHLRECVMETSLDVNAPTLPRLVKFSECMGYEVCVVPAERVPEGAIVIDAI